MGHTAVDTLSMFDELKKAFSEEQAHTLSELLRSIEEENLEVLTTKRDLKEMELILRRDMKEMETKLTHDMKEMETKLTRDMKEMETKLTRDMKEMGIQLKHDLTLRLGVMLAACMALISTIVKLIG